MKLTLEEIGDMPVWFGRDRDCCQDLYRGVYPARMTGGRHTEFCQAADRLPGGTLGARRTMSFRSPLHLVGEKRDMEMYGLGLPTIVRFATCNHPILAEAVAAVNEAGGNCWMDADDDWRAFPRP